MSFILSHLKKIQKTKKIDFVRYVWQENYLINEMENIKWVSLLHFKQTYFSIFQYIQRKGMFWKDMN